MPTNRRLTDNERRAVARRRVLLANEQYGPAYARLSLPDRNTVDALLLAGDSGAARREVLRLDEMRRLRRRGVGVSLNGVAIDRSLTPLGGRVPIRDHEVRGFSLFEFDYQCVVTVREFDGKITRIITNNLPFDYWPTKQEIAEFGIELTTAAMGRPDEGSPDVPQGTIIRIALLVARRRA